MALIDNRATMTQRSRDLPVATRSPLPPLGKGTVGPNISPYAVAAAQAKPQEAKPVVKAAPLAPVAPATQYATPYIPSIAPFGPPPPKEQGVALDTVPRPVVKGYSPAGETPGIFNDADGDGYDDKTGLPKMAWADPEGYASLPDFQGKTRPADRPEYDFWGEASGALGTTGLTYEEPGVFQSIEAKLQSGDQFITEDDVNDKYASMEADSEMWFQQHAAHQDALMASQGLSGTGARGVAMGNIRAQALADLNKNKADLWFKVKLRNSELYMQSIQTEQEIAMKKGDWAHAAELQQDFLASKHEIDMWNAAHGGVDTMIAYEDQFGWEDPAMKAQLAKDFERVLASGELSEAQKLQSGMGVNAAGQLTYHSPWAEEEEEEDKPGVLE